MRRLASSRPGSWETVEFVKSMRSIVKRIVPVELIDRLRGAIALALARMRERLRQPGAQAELVTATDDDGASVVTQYWSRYTVRAKPYLTTRASERYLQWRFAQYPRFRELSGLWGDHDGEVVLDYGCGPGNDLVGFASHSRAKFIIGADVSLTALVLARDRLALHGAGSQRARLLQLLEGHESVPLEDASVDFFSSQGVLHHASSPVRPLRELHRVLKPGGEASVMVYNRDSVWFHLYVAWERQIRAGEWPGLDIDDAFRRSTDGEDCPIARAYRHEEWIDICAEAGFEAKYLGGYLSQPELRALDGSRRAAIADDRLAEEHRDFLGRLELDADGMPLYEGYLAGFGGTYRLRRPG
jgi:ubiquinone/menaquinone biosynthesis C-methylase UbiE